jgi:hypothetical protein
MVVLLAGSGAADARHLPVVRAALGQFAGRGPVTIRHTGNGIGVDALASQVAVERGWMVDPQKTVWSDCGPVCPKRPHRRFDHRGREFCPYAGAHNHQRMIGMRPRPDMVVVFPATSAKPRGGTWDLARRAAAAGLPIRVFPLTIRTGVTVQ